MKTLSAIGVLSLAAGVVATSGSASAQAGKEPKKLLVVSVTKGYRHASIPVIETVLQDLAKQSGAFSLDYAKTDEDLAQKMTATALDGYDGVLFASTTGDLPLPDRDAFLKWLEAGHGFIGVHAATDTFHNWRPFIAMIGGEFKTHGPQVTVSVLVEDKQHPSTKAIPAPLDVHDEIYEFKSFERERVKVLLYMDKHPQSKEPGFYPLAWTRAQGKGRVFYTALGHREDVLQAAWFKEHLLGGVRWALSR